MNITVGSPATHHIGGDRYACIVTAVEYFKSGKRKGELKAVEAEFADLDETTGKVTRKGAARHRYLPRIIGPCRLHGLNNQRICGECARVGKTVLDGTYEGRRATWERLTIGKAEEYRDPSF